MFEFESEFNKESVLEKILVLAKKEHFMEVCGYVVVNKEGIDFIEDYSYSNQVLDTLNKYVKGDLSKVDYITEVIDRETENPYAGVSIHNTAQTIYSKIEKIKNDNTEERRKNLVDYFKYFVLYNKATINFRPELSENIILKGYFHVHPGGVPPSQMDEIKSNSLFYQKLDFPMYVFTAGPYELFIYKCYKGKTNLVFKKEHNILNN